MWWGFWGSGVGYLVGRNPPQAVGDPVNSRPPSLESGQGAKLLKVGEQCVGEAISVDWQNLKSLNSWMLPCAFAQSDLLRTAYQLRNKRVWIPGTSTTTDIPMCSLREIATLGPDRRDIHDGFELSDVATAFPAFWGHNSESVTSIHQLPNRWLSPLSEARGGRPLRKLEHLWPKAGQLLLAERVRLNTQRLLAVQCSTSVLSNVWWPVRLLDSVADCADILAMWLNSTYGFINMVAQREETEGAWIDFKKPSLEELLVLDPRELSTRQMRKLNAASAAVMKDSILPFAQIDHDPVLKKIDLAFAEALGIPDPEVIRQMLANEPVVTLKRA